MNDPDFPRALPPPGTTITVIDDSMLERAIEASNRSPRRRIIQPFHCCDDDVLQRMLNALQPGSYIQPHCHGSPPKAESILVLRGSIAYVTFSEHGEIERIFHLAAASPCFGIDTAPGVYHTFFALEPDTVLFEVKPGPYAVTTDKQFAPWSPPEGSDEGRRYLDRLMQAAKR